MSEAFIIDGTRSPVGRYGGALAGIRSDDLAATVIAEAALRAGIDPAEIDEVILGNTNQAGEDNRNVARMAVLLAGFPVEVPGMTVNRLCASGMSAITIASQMVKSGAADIVIAGGVESMTRAPWVMEKPRKAFGRPGEIADTSIGGRFVNPRFKAMPGHTFSMPETAEELARIDGISRADADAFSLRSHQRSVAAIDAGHFDSEIVTIETEAGTVTQDEGPRPDTTLEQLSRLRSIVRPDGIVTAGNSSSLNDGASAVVVASEAAVKRLGLLPRARIVAGAAAGVAPGIMGIGPVPATHKVLTQAGWSLSDIAAIELNEAFAVQALACIRRLGLDEDIVNRDGGAIALGHPLGSSGSRIVLTLLNRMEREDAGRGLATMCVGLGQGTALLLERV